MTLTKSSHGLLKILLIPCTVGLAFVVLNLYVSLSYFQYLERDKAVRPLFIQLNLDVLDQISAPDGVMEIERVSSYGHGSVLGVKYKLQNISIEAVVSHYDLLLVSMGWQKSETHIKTYVKGTSCFTVDYYAMSDQYRILIKHDYFKQDFTPKMPPMWVIILNESGESQFSRCSDPLANGR